MCNHTLPPSSEGPYPMLHTPCSKRSAKSGHPEVMPFCDSRSVPRPEPRLEADCEVRRRTFRVRVQNESTGRSLAGRCLGLAASGDGESYLWLCCAAV